MLAVFNLGGGEIILVLALVLILFGADRLPGSGRRLFIFRDDADNTAREAGRSLGGIFGTRAAQPLTPDNQVAELYRPAAFQDEPKPQRNLRAWWRLFKKMWCRVVSLLTRQ